MEDRVAADFLHKGVHAVLQLPHVEFRFVRKIGNAEAPAEIERP